MPLPQSSIARINWFLTLVCVALSIVIAVPKGDLPITPTALFVTAIVLAVLLVPAAITVWFTKRLSQFPYWGVSFLLGWLVPVILVVMFISLVYRR